MAGVKIWILMRLADEDWSFEGAFYNPCRALRKAIEIQIQEGYKGNVKVSYSSPTYERYVIDNVEYEITQTTIQ